MTASKTSASFQPYLVFLNVSITRNILEVLDKKEEFVINKLIKKKSKYGCQ